LYPTEEASASEAGPGRSRPDKQGDDLTGDAGYVAAADEGFLRTAIDLEFGEFPDVHIDEIGLGAARVGEESPAHPHRPGGFRRQLALGIASQDGSRISEAF
jgi:hypothetical protein